MPDWVISLGKAEAGAGGAVDIVWGFARVELCFSFLFSWGGEECVCMCREGSMSAGCDGNWLQTLGAESDGMV